MNYFPTMKYLLLGGLFNVLYTVSSSQSVESSPTIYNGIGTLTNISGQNLNLYTVLDNNSGLKISTTKRVEGSAFLCNDWHWGYIQFPNGAIVDSIQLRFNIISGELCFLDGQKVYCLDDHYTEFGYTESEKEGTPKLIFKTGFPAIGKNNTKTNYQLLADGKYVLLKTSRRELQENRSLDGQTYYRIGEEINYFVYDSSSGSMIGLKKNLQQSSAGLVNLKNEITDYCNTDRQKCRTEAGMIEFFSGINKVPRKAF